LSNCALLAPAQEARHGIKQFTYLTARDGRARPVIEHFPEEDPARQRLWPVHGTCVGDHVYVYYHKITLDPKVDVFLGFTLNGMGVARARVGEWQFQRLPAPDGSHEWWKGDQPGFGVFVEPRPDGWVYLWGSLLTGMYLARCRPDQLDQLSSYEYLVDGPTSERPTMPARWSSTWKPTAARFDSVPNEMSAHYNDYLKKHIAIHMWNRDNRIVMRTAPDIVGPWSQASTIWTPAREAADEFFYAAKEHPELATDGGRIVYVTYVETVHYSPRLVEVRFR
jgi:hypothetical protein